ncbi:uncharacterized protein MONOS_17369 [Monocercomonoides exilis]|uniref:uncharacterized protein n=1 Tax=Monocercomonoides exilis TaxID=2049356 RepID=UPI003559D8D8|nr:hypothetical protein MONOS_17369 [Monocercomonoides exilis]
MSNTKKYRTFLLSKKRWHVGLPENIARVKRDEMEQEMEQEKMKKNSIAMEQEHRLEVLRSQRSKMQINQTIVDITKRSSSPSDEDVSQSKLKSTPPLWTFKDLNEIPWYTKSRFKEENHSRIQNMEDPLNDRLYTDTKSDTEKLGEDIMCIIDEKKSSSEEQKSDQDSFQDIIELKAIDGENSEIVLGDSSSS